MDVTVEQFFRSVAAAHWRTGEDYVHASMVAGYNMGVQLGVVDDLAEVAELLPLVVGSVHSTAFLRSVELGVPYRFSDDMVMALAGWSDMRFNRACPAMRDNFGGSEDAIRERYLFYVDAGLQHVDPRYFAAAISAGVAPADAVTAWVAGVPVEYALASA